MPFVRLHRLHEQRRGRAAACAPAGGAAEQRAEGHHRISGRSPAAEVSPDRRYSVALSVWRLERRRQHGCCGTVYKLRNAECLPGDSGADRRFLGSDPGAGGPVRRGGQHKHRGHEQRRRNAAAGGLCGHQRGKISFSICLSGAHPYAGDGAGIFPV